MMKIQCQVYFRLEQTMEYIYIENRLQTSEQTKQISQKGYPFKPAFMS